MKTRCKSGPRQPWRLLDKQIDTDGYEIPEHPLLSDLAKADLRQLHHIKSYFFFPQKKLQQNRQIAEHLTIELDIAPQAPRGLHEVRLLSKSGISNPIRFFVDTLPETQECEPNDTPTVTTDEFPKPIAKAFTQRTHDLPLVMNGQIMPGDVDRIRFRATAGFRLRAQIHARTLIPYLADAVPGWFQCVLSLQDDQGRELAYADDSGIDPDPTIETTIPENGTYVLIVRDAIYRGRQDFVYRLSISDHAHTPLPMPTPPHDLIPSVGQPFRPPQEQEPNDTLNQAESMHPPVLLRGTIAHPGDIDRFRIQGQKDHEIVAECYARRLGSPLDSLLRLRDANGTVIAWNDDAFTKEGHLHVDHTGTTTHHADAYLRAVLPATGRYVIEISDTQGNGSAQHTYTLRICEPQPAFALRVSPSAITGGRGANIPITVHALRQDGLQTPIKLELAGAPAGTHLEPAWIPEGATHANLTLTLPNRLMTEPTTFRLRGAAREGNSYVRAEAIPADNLMQAFLWRHLVPAQEMLLCTTKQWNPIPPMRRVPHRPIKLVAGTPESIVMQCERPFRIQEGDRYTLNLLDTAPRGLTIISDATQISATEWRFKLLYTPESDSLHPLNQNLIIQVLREYLPKAREGAPKPTRRQDPVGFLPALRVDFQNGLESRGPG